MNLIKRGISVINKNMTKRERVERTINLKEVDRVPIYDLLRCDKAIEYFSGEKISPYIKEKNIEKLNEITGKAVNRLLDMTRSFGFGEVEERIWEDEYGFVWHSNPYEKTSWIEKRPFKDEKGGIEFIKKLILRYRNEMKEIKENQRAYRENYHKEFLRIQSLIGETVYVIANQGTGLDTIRYLLGLDLFSYIYFDNPEIISEFLEVYTDLQRIYVSKYFHNFVE